MSIAEDTIEIRRCMTCGIFEPQKLGFGGRIVSMPCAHNNWKTIRYQPVAIIPRQMAFQQPRFPPGPAITR